MFRMFKIYHSKSDRFRDAGFWKHVFPGPESHKNRMYFPQDYVEVAEIATSEDDMHDALEAAWKSTNHIEEDWTQGVNAFVLPEFRGHCRSSAVGDIFEDITTGELYIVDSSGFKRLDRGYLNPIRKWYNVE